MLFKIDMKLCVGSSSASYKDDYKVVSVSIHDHSQFLGAYGTIKTTPFEIKCLFSILFKFCF